MRSDAARRGPAGRPNPGCRPIAWGQLAALAVAEDVPADQVAFFAEEVFAYIDELSAASVAGHAEETATTGRVLARYRERLARSLLRGEPEADVVAAAERAAWPQ